MKGQQAELETIMIYHSSEASILHGFDTSIWISHLNPEGPDSRG